ncbi:hypothetical protein [Streptacidiphilus fuscans]|uniref:Uncharacterized protein n=1 Tax=Streptacidiphilus fuscans TaxID=2789292 RepID=A0A931FCV4_9ACTN|nr:hypothetical protein [Streptacidiphilus fuscans]MBF9067550.1 hypothetical protein [Streptacidiphilus fuscans]
MTKALTTSGAPDSSAPRSSKRLRLLSVAALGLAAGVALSGCSSSGSSSGSSGRASGPATGSASAVATPSASATGSSSTGTVLKLDENAKGHTVHVPVGGTVLLTMHNITWSTPKVSNPADLSPLGLPEIGPGTDCHPGSGCGTKSTRFVARQAGTVTITETRTSCGEARRCTDGQGTYTVTVVIG